jgi:hypothetical protein
LSALLLRLVVGAFVIMTGDGIHLVGSRGVKIMRVFEMAEDQVEDFEGEI